MTKSNVPLQDSAPQCQVEFGLGKTNAHTFDVIPFRVPRMTLIGKRGERGSTLRSHLFIGQRSNQIDLIEEESAAIHFSSGS